MLISPAIALRPHSCHPKVMKKDTKHMNGRLPLVFAAEVRRDSAVSPALWLF